MAYEKAWQFDSNRALADGTTQPLQTGSYLYALVRAITGATGLVNGLWTVVGSSDAATAALDGANRWTDQTKIVRAAAGVAHSWIVLRSPVIGGQSYWLILDVAGTTDALAVNLYLCNVIPTGGSTTNRPTATGNEAPLTGRRTGAGSAPVTAKSHVALAPDGSFFAYSTRNSGGNLRSDAFLAVLAPVAAPPQIWPYLAFGQNSATLIYSNFANAVSNWTGAIGRAGKAPTVLLTTSVLGVMPCRSDATCVFSVVSASLGDVVRGGTFPKWPFYLEWDTSPYGMLGRLADIYFAVTAWTGLAATTAPTGGPVEYVQLENFWIPADQAPTA